MEKKETYEVDVEIKVNSGEVDEAIEKLEKLIHLAREANTFGILASAEDEDK